MLRRICGRWTIGLVLCAAALTHEVGAADRILPFTRIQEETGKTENKVAHRCLTPTISEEPILNEERRSAWSLPRLALAPDFDTTIHCLVLRYNFQYEDTDDPLTTGRGHMDLSPHPIPTQYNSTTPADSVAYLAAVGHFVDPPPHDSIYYDRHMQALNAYWESVSEGKIHLTWDIFPPGQDSIYQLPYPMSHYGQCDFSQVIQGLEYYFEDCIHLADSAHIIDPLHPDIDFSLYQSTFLFHAGSDGQNDFGFPNTCRDLFTGFIRFGVPIPVDGGTGVAGKALMMPETASQDNRATALNAVMAHEFGHQLGLVDLYRTDVFMSQLGDFALMDNNGFGTGLDFGWPVGGVFGSVPVYPSAWSRAFLGLNEVVDFRQGTDINIVAAEVASAGIKLARVPISETEYYLIENRVENTDGLPQGVQFDERTNVMLWPARVGADSLEQTGEYDLLLPGSGMLIFHVDEGVAGLDFDGDGLNNFADNQVQLDPHRRFVRLVEADGLVNFGGYYRSGTGSPEDMFRDDRQNSFTPNTNPAAIDNTGNNTHVYITDISRVPDTTVPKQPLMDTLISFDVETDRRVDGFPVRVGIPRLGLSPIADDLDGDGQNELIVASGSHLAVFTTFGTNFLQSIDSCLTCEPYYDTMITSINRPQSLQPVKVHPVPLYYKAQDLITAGPVTGDFGQVGTERLVAFGYPISGGGVVLTVEPADANDDGEADVVGSPITTDGFPLALSFGDILYALSLDTVTYRYFTYRLDSVQMANPTTWTLNAGDFLGHCRIGNNWLLMFSDSATADDSTQLVWVGESLQEFSVGGSYQLGPIAVDMNRDGMPEVVMFSANGDGLILEIDTSLTVPQLATVARRATGWRLTVPPSVADVDLDGYPDIVVGGQNAVYAFDDQLLLKLNYPIEIDDGYLEANVIARVIAADIESGGRQELVLSTEVGNVYAFGPELAYGFPVSSGEQIPFYSGSSAIVFHDSTGGKLGYLGGDGWFYAWEVNYDGLSSDWPMAASGPSGSFAFEDSRLGAPNLLADRLPGDRFFNYPNPVIDGRTTIRYYLGEQPESVRLDIYDLSGERVYTTSGPARGGSENELVWDCSTVTPGVYRCILNAEFGGGNEKDFIDIAVIK